MQIGTIRIERRRGDLVVVDAWPEHCVIHIDLLTGANPVITIDDAGRVRMTVSNGSGLYKLSKMQDAGRGGLTFDRVEFFYSAPPPQPDDKTNTEF